MAVGLPTVTVDICTPNLCTREKNDARGNARRGQFGPGPSPGDRAHVRCILSSEYVRDVILR